MNSAQKTSSLSISDKMKSDKPIQVFEYDTLWIEKHRFSESHWKALGWYNERHGNRFFTLTPNGVKFCQFVGVIQVGNLTIEVLPKIGKTVSEKEKSKWQKVLIDMLKDCRWMQLHANERASLRFKPNSILEAYFELFVSECERLLREGLVKKYRSLSGNCFALKGRLEFGQNISKNLVHAERFYTTHSIFDRENLFNQILLKAIRLVPALTNSPLLNDRVGNLMLAFPELKDIMVGQQTFEKLRFDQKSERYREAIEMAAMILLNYRPDITGGSNNVLAILFDMNELWERYVFRQVFLNKLEGWTVRDQRKKSFWQLNDNVWPKYIRPDIVISNEQGKQLIIDTKWKLPEKNVPSDADLKQMFVYNEFWESKHAILFYPQAFYGKEPEYWPGMFKEKGHQCGVMKMSVLNEDNTSLDRTMGKRLNEFLKESLLG